jgi:two-component system nitrogen regulation response regulator GlnG
MPVEPYEDEPTLLPASDDEPTFLPQPKAAALVPAFTIQWHPDVTRIGESACLLGFLPGRSARLTRKEPLFSLARAAGQPLDHPSISGKAVSLEITCTAPARYELRRGDVEASCRVEINGQPLTATLELNDTDLSAGVSIVVGDVALYLHQCTWPRPGDGHHDLGIVGVSDLAHELRDAVKRCARFRTPIFLSGESGAGKTFVAEAIHRFGSPDGPFVAVNVANLTRDLAVSSLFGHEKGAFTGAAAKHRGYFADANGGTLFLDEIGAAAIDVQRKLLKAIEDREILPLGSSRPAKVDVRVVTATNADLPTLVRDGTFSVELLERLIVDEIHVPPLRSRREDVGILLLELLRRELQSLGELDRLRTPPPGRKPWLGASAVAAFVKLSTQFQGNVRRLSNIAHRLVSFSASSDRSSDRAQVDPVLSWLLQKIEEDYQASAPFPAGPPTSSRRTPAPSLSSVSDQDFRRLYEESGRNLERLAQTLGVHKSTVYRRLQKDPTIPKTSGIADAQILSALDAADGDVATAANSIGLPRRHFQQRLARIRRR